jgi:hypothetical protein
MRKKSYYHKISSTTLDNADIIKENYPNLLKMIKDADYISYSSFGRPSARITKTYTAKDGDDFWFKNSKKRAVSLLKRAFKDNPLPSNVTTAGYLIVAEPYESPSDSERVLPIVKIVIQNGRYTLQINNFRFWKKEGMPYERI